MAPACLFLAAKVEEQPRKLEHVIKVAHACLNRDHNTPTPDPKTEVLFLFHILKLKLFYHLYSLQFNLILLLHRFPSFVFANTSNVNDLGGM